MINCESCGELFKPRSRNTAKRRNRLCLRCRQAPNLTAITERLLDSNRPGGGLKGALNASRSAMMKDLERLQMLQAQGLGDQPVPDDLDPRRRHEHRKLGRT